MRYQSHWNRIVLALLFGLAASASEAHTGHGTSGLYEGLAHPFGLDHLLAMVAVGIWSVSALPAKQTWWGPAVFMSSLIVSAVAGAIGVALPFLENLISLSVVLFGAMLVLSRFQTNAVVGLLLIAVAAAMHGLAHGAESPESSFKVYALGFLMTSAALHFGGVALGMSLKRYAPNTVSWVNTALGLVFGGTGLYLLIQI